MIYPSINASQEVSIRRVIARMGVPLSTKKPIELINPERLFMRVMEKGKGIPVYGKLTLLCSTRQTISPIPMEPSLPPFIEGRVIEFPMSQERGLIRARILQDNGCVYMKPMRGGSLGKGICRIELRDNSFVLSSKDNDLMSCAVRGFSTDLNDFFSVSPGTISQLIIRPKNEQQEMQPQFIARFFGLVEAIFAEKFGPSILEKKIETPTIENQEGVGNCVWEIRTIVLNGKVRTSYAKVGSSNIVANLSRGGFSSPSLEAVKAAYRTLFSNIGEDHDNALIASLADRFLEDTYMYAEKVCAALSSHFTLLRDIYAPEYPFSPIQVTDFAPDFMGMICGKRLQPVLVDVNFSYLMEGLGRVDHSTSQNVTAERKLISEKFLGQIAALDK